MTFVSSDCVILYRSRTKGAARCMIVDGVDFTMDEGCLKLKGRTCGHGESVEIKLDPWAVYFDKSGDVVNGQVISGNFVDDQHIREVRQILMSSHCRPC